MPLAITYISPNSYFLLTWLKKPKTFRLTHINQHLLHMLYLTIFLFPSRARTQFSNKPHPPSRTRHMPESKICRYLNNNNNNKDNKDILNKTTMISCTYCKQERMSSNIIIVVVSWISSINLKLFSEFSKLMFMLKKHKCAINF